MFYCSSVVIKPKSKEDLTKEWFEELEKSPLSEITWLELKESGYSEIGNKIVGFLNSTSGGLILIGIGQEKDGKAVIKSVRNIQKEMDRLSDFLFNITDSCNDDVKIEPITYKEKNILSLFISSGSKFPYFYKGLIYLRTGSNTYPVTDKRQIINLLSSKIDRKKALRIFKSLLDKILTLVKNLENSIRHLESEKPSYTKAFANLPVKISIDSLRLHYPNVEGWLTENNLMAIYYEILRRIVHVNSRLEVLYTHFDSYVSYLDFGTMTTELQNDLKAVLNKLNQEGL